MFQYLCGTLLLRNAREVLTRTKNTGYDEVPFLTESFRLPALEAWGYSLWRNMTRCRRVAGLAVLLVSCQTVWASGFSILELGARASGMGGAFTGIADDASAI